MLPLFSEAELRVTTCGRAESFGALPARREDPIAPAVLALLRSATNGTLKGAPTLSFPQCDRKLYENAVVILNACGFEWVARKKTHVGTAAGAKQFAGIVDRGTFFNSQRALEFFATSDDYATDLVAELERYWLGESDHPKILEPSAGDGALVTAILDAYPHALVTAVELDERRAERLSIRFADDARVRVVQCEILDFTETGWDAVVMNPPFEYAYAHVRHVASLTRPGAPVIGIAMTTRKQDAELATYLNQRDAEVWNTENGAFVGTSIRASAFRFETYPSTYDWYRKALAEHPAIGERSLHELMEISAHLHKTFERNCNGDYETEGEYEAIVDALLTRARELLAGENIDLVPAWDPRAGHGLRLKLPSGVTTDFGRTGVIIPNGLVSNVFTVSTGKRDRGTSVWVSDEDGVAYEESA